MVIPIPSRLLMRKYPRNPHLTRRCNPWFGSGINKSQQSSRPLESFLEIHNRKRISLASSWLVSNKAINRPGYDGEMVLVWGCNHPNAWRLQLSINCGNITDNGSDEMPLVVWASSPPEKSCWDRRRKTLISLSKSILSPIPFFKRSSPITNFFFDRQYSSLDIWYHL